MVNHSSKVHPKLERKPGKADNWVEKTGGLPSYINRIAKHINSDGKLSVSQAIAAAVNQVKVLAGKGNAEAIKALAEWNAKKAKTKIKMSHGDSPHTLNDYELAEIIEVVGYRRLDFIGRNSGASGSGKPFDESKYLRNPGNGKFSAKFTPTELIAGRRIVEGLITNLMVGQTAKFPGDSGWAIRSDAGYLIQGPAGIRVAVRTLSEAIQAAANIMAGKLSRIGDPTT